MTPAERNALGFFALLAAAGAGARALGIGDPPGAHPPTAADRLALQHQLAAVDSAHAGRERGRGAKRGAKRGGGRAAREPATRASAGPRATSPQSPTTPPAPPEPHGPLDVNAADSAALETLPGVGPALAHRILADRAAHGPYASMTDLSRVPGIGAGLERRLGPTVTFTPGGRPSSGSVPPPDGARSAPVRAPSGARAGWPAP